MTDGNDSDADKPYAASKKKLEDARKKGNILRSQDTVTLVSLSLLFSMLVFFLESWFIDSLLFQKFFIANLAISMNIDDGHLLKVHIFEWYKFLFFLAFFTPPIIIIIGLISFKQIAPSAEKIEPKLNRISIIQGVKKKFGASGVIEFLKGLLKFLLFCYVLFFALSFGNLIFERTPHLENQSSILEIYLENKKWIYSFISLYIIYAAVDLLWSRYDFEKNQRMSHKELKDEQKNEEGDEVIRQQRRAKAEEIATNKMLLDVPTSTVVITNPTHYAVALKWSGAQNTVPRCVAKGADEIARRIRETAVQSGVPIVQDPPAARRLFATVDIGVEIQEEHYRAVAAAVSYAKRIERMVHQGSRG